MATRLYDNEDDSCYRDFRSDSRPKRLDAKQSAKYYGYRGVHPSWVGQSYISVHLPQSKDKYDFGLHDYYRLPSDPVLTYPNSTEVRTWTKRDMYREADRNIWPLDRRHSVGRKIRDRYNCKWTMRSIHRRGKQKARFVETAVEDVPALLSMIDEDTDWEPSAEEDWLEQVLFEENADASHGETEVDEVVSECWVEEPAGPLPADRPSDGGSDSEFDKLSELDFDQISVDWSDGEG